MYLRLKIGYLNIVLITMPTATPATGGLNNHLRNQTQHDATRAKFT